MPAKNPPLTGIGAPQLNQLQEQYRDSLEAERRAQARRRNARLEREAAEHALIMARENARFDEPNPAKLLARITDALLKERATSDQVSACKKDCRAATIAYMSHLGDDL